MIIMAERQSQGFYSFVSQDSEKVLVGTGAQQQVYVSLAAEVKRQKEWSWFV